MSIGSGSRAKTKSPRSRTVSSAASVLVWMRWQMVRGAVPLGWLWIPAAVVLMCLMVWWRNRVCWFRSTTSQAENAGLRQQLDVAQRQLRESVNARSRFVKDLAREIKEPLAVVLLQARRLAAGGEEPDEARECAKRVLEDTRHLSDMVESFLRLSLPTSAEDTRHHVPVPVHDVVLEAVRNCHCLIASRHVSVVPILAETEDDVGVEVLGDPFLLQAMVGNLVRNAVSSAPRDSRVDLTVRVEDERVVLAVRDQGTSIDAGEAELVFDGFFGLPEPPRLSAGTGFSLSVAKRVAQHHRGAIALRNLPEGGCEFEVQLPRWRSVGGSEKLRSTLRVVTD